jgi:hypothetical protein
VGFFGGIFSTIWRKYLQKKKKKKRKKKKAQNFKEV